MKKVVEVEKLSNQDENRRLKKGLLQVEHKTRKLQSFMLHQNDRFMTLGKSHLSHQLGESLQKIDFRPVYAKMPDFASDACGATVIESSGGIETPSNIFGFLAGRKLDNLALQSNTQVKQVCVSVSFIQDVARGMLALSSARVLFANKFMQTLVSKYPGHSPYSKRVISLKKRNCISSTRCDTSNQQ